MHGNRSGHRAAILLCVGSVLILRLHSFFNNVLGDVPQRTQFGDIAWLLAEEGRRDFLPIMLLYLVTLLLQALCMYALHIMVGKFLLLNLNLLRFLFDLDFLCCSPPPLSFLLQFLWSCRERGENTSLELIPLL